MGSSKKTEDTKQQTQQTQANTYGFVERPRTPELLDYRNQIDETYNTGDPNIAYDFNRQRENLNNRFDNPFGANYSPEVMDAIKFQGNQELDQAQGQAYRQNNYQNQQGKLSAVGAYADATAPQMVQTGGSSTGNMTGTTTSVVPFNWNSVIGAGAQLGSAAMGLPAVT